MSDPDPADLLALAREALQTQIVPVLPAGQRFTAAMIANAMAVSVRAFADHADDNAAIAAARERLRALVDSAVAGNHATFDQHLVREIRAGSYDRSSPVREALVTYAQAILQRRLAVTAGRPGRLVGTESSETRRPADPTNRSG